MFSTVEQGQATVSLRHGAWKVTESLSSSGFDRNASFAQESRSEDISLLNGLLKDIMHLLDLWDLRQYTHHTAINGFLDPKD